MAIPVYGTIAEAVQGLRDRGFVGNFECFGRVLRDLNSGRSFEPDELTIIEHHRFEGMSDPDDLAVVYALEAQDGTRGTLVDAYGVYSDPELSAFLDRVAMQENR